MKPFAFGISSSTQTKQLSFSPALSRCFVCDYTTAATSQKKKKKEKRLFFVPHFLSLLMYRCEFSKASAHRPFSKRAKNSKLKEAMTSGRQHRYRYVPNTYKPPPSFECACQGNSWLRRELANTHTHTHTRRRRRNRRWAQRPPPLFLHWAGHFERKRARVFLSFCVYIYTQSPMYIGRTHTHTGRLCICTRALAFYTWMQ
jgi:hypothetical protein